MSDTEVDPVAMHKASSLLADLIIDMAKEYRAQFDISPSLESMAIQMCRAFELAGFMDKRFPNIPADVREHVLLNAQMLVFSRVDPERFGGALRFALSDDALEGRTRH